MCLNGKAHAVFVVDVGGTYVRVAVVSPEGAILTRSKNPTPTGVSTAELIEHIDDVLHSLQVPAVIEGVVLGIPGIIDATAGRVRRSANLGWVNADVQKIARSHWQQPVLIENDVRLHTLGEMAFGCGRGVYLPWIHVVIGTGIAANLVVGKNLPDRRFVFGHHGHAKPSVHSIGSQHRPVKMKFFQQFDSKRPRSMRCFMV